MPFVRPDIDAVAPLTAMLASGVSGKIETRFPMIALPPLEFGAVQVKVAERTPPCAMTFAGAPGTDRMAIWIKIADVPPALDAVTVKRVGG